MVGLAVWQGVGSALDADAVGRVEIPIMNA